jgi:hypothetical protein
MKKIKLDQTSPTMWTVVGTDLGIEKIDECNYAVWKLWNGNPLRLADRSFSSRAMAEHFLTSVIKERN